MASELAQVLLRARSGNPVEEFVRALDEMPDRAAEAPVVMNPTWQYRLGRAADEHFADKPAFDWGAFRGPSGERDDPMRERQAEATVPLALGAAIGGAAFAPRGSLGMAGGKLVQPDMLDAGLPRSIVTPSGTSISGPGAVFFSAKNKDPSQFYYLARRQGMDRDMVVKVDKGNWDAPTHNNEVNWSFADQFKKHPDMWNEVDQYHAAEGAGTFNREPFRALHDVMRTDAGIRKPASYVYQPAQEAFRDTNARQRIYEMMMRKEFPGWKMEPIAGRDGYVRVNTGHAPEAGNFNYSFLADRVGSRNVNEILRNLLQ